MRGRRFFLVRSTERRKREVRQEIKCVKQENGQTENEADWAVAAEAVDKHRHQKCHKLWVDPFFSFRRGQVVDEYERAMVIG